jgi:hypothetical protein
VLIRAAGRMARVGTASICVRETVAAEFVVPESCRKYRLRVEVVDSG